MKIRVMCEGTETVDFHRIEPFQGELKKLDKENEARLKETILKRGFKFPFFVWKKDKHLYAIDGHQRCKALAALEQEGHEIPPLPVVHIKAATVKEAKEDLIMAVGQYGKIYPQGLKEYLDAAEIPVDFLAGIELPDFNHANFLAEFYQIPGSNPETNPVPTPPAKPKSKAGDLYILGNHRLICGDSSKPEVLDRLMGADKLTLMFTDPPYGVSYAEKANAYNPKKKKEVRAIENDDLQGEDLYKLLVGAFANAARKADRINAYYVATGDGMGLFQMMRALQDGGWQIKQTLIWLKNTHVPCRTDYSYKHEKLIYGWSRETEAMLKKEGWGRLAIPAWVKEDCMILDRHLDTYENVLYGWSEKGIHVYRGNFQTTVWEYDKPSRNDLHPTMKPVPMIERAIFNSTIRGQVVLDIFGGSGSTLIAAENTGRAARLVEIDPAYCDVIVERWENHTKQKAKKE